jgi:hypothetical protein
MTHPKKYKIPTFLLLCFALYAYYAWQNKIELTERFISTMPASIEPDGYAMRNVSTALFNDLIQDSCGVTAIHISDKTANRIKQQGHSFFETAKQSRSNDVRISGPLLYKVWQRYSKPANDSLGDSMIMAIFDCAGRSGIPDRQIIRGLKGGNAYYSSQSGYSEFYVLPDQKLFLHAFID